MEEVRASNSNRSGGQVSSGTGGCARAAAQISSYFPTDQTSAASCASSACASVDCTPNVYLPNLKFLDFFYHYCYQVWKGQNREMRTAGGMLSKSSGSLVPSPGIESKLWGKVYSKG